MCILVPWQNLLIYIDIMLVDIPLGQKVRAHFDVSRLHWPWFAPPSHFLRSQKTKPGQAAGDCAVHHGNAALASGSVRR